jgi:hypothetical protein
MMKTIENPSKILKESSKFFKILKDLENPCGSMWIH